jgi:hypothetical protein
MRFMTRQLKGFRRFRKVQAVVATLPLPQFGPMQEPRTPEEIEADMFYSVYPRQSCGISGLRMLINRERG